MEMQVMKLHTKISEKILRYTFSAMGMILLSAFAITQDLNSPRFERLSSENIKLVKGLSQNWIYSILQDKHGYMWFGTWDGLNQFDGYRFTSYNIADGLSDHTIYCMIEGSDGNLWIGTDDGLNKFNRKYKSFQQINDRSADTTARYFNRILHILQTSDSVIWLATGAGLKKYNILNNTFTSYLSTTQEYFSPRSNYVLHLTEDDKGNLWASTTYGLVILDPISGRSTRYYHIPEDSTSLSNDNVRCVIQEKSGNFWIGTRFGLNYYDTTTQKIKRYFFDPENSKSLGGNWVRTIYEDKSGKIWIGTDKGGLSVYNRKEDNFTRYTNRFNDNSSLSNDRVYSIYEDFIGNIWIGTYNGVNKINKYSNDFNHVQQSTPQVKGLNSNFIWDFFEDNNDQLWIGTSNGVNILDRKSGKFSYLVNDPGRINSMNSNEVRTMLYTPEYNAVWLGLYGTGIDRFDLETYEFRHYVPQATKNSLSDIYISDLAKSDDGMIWICTSRGLNCLDPMTNNFAVFTHIPDNLKSISNDICYSIFEDSNKDLWVGTENGLNKFNRHDTSFTRYFFGKNNPLNSNSFFYVTEDQTGKLWLGTSGNGLVKFHPETGDYDVYTTEDGLPNNIVYGILVDGDNNLWLSTNMGLVKFYVISERFVVYDVKEGIQSYEFNLGSCYQNHEGKMYFGGLNGYNVFFPEAIQTNPVKPVIVISSFRKFNEIQAFEVLNGDTIRLDHDDNFFSFEISSLDYTNPGKNKYKYYLEGFDKDWVTADASNRLAEYKKVRPGYYTFYARGSNNDGIWNEEGIVVYVIVDPPWYETWVFRISASLFIVAILYFFVSRRIKRIRDRNKVEKKMLEIEKQRFELEQKALRLQMNPHFIFNSLNSIQSYILTHNTELAVTYLGKFSQLMRLILNNSGNNFIPFKEELKAIRHYLDLEKLRFDNKFEYDIKVDNNIDKEFVEIPPMVIQPYIENAIIHGILHKPEKGKININFELKEEYIYCSITDNGIGREKASKIKASTGINRKSTGMHITQARLEMLRREDNEDLVVKITDLRDTGGQPSGTKVELLIHFNED